MPRADAVRNRQRVLSAARAAFAEQGPAVSLDDVARLAGVGAGTVHRHFPTKDALFAAVIADRLQELAALATSLAGPADPNTANPGAANPGAASPGTANRGPADPGTANPNAADPGIVDPGAVGLAGAGDLGAAGPGTADPSTAGPGTAGPGTAGRPGAGDPGAAFYEFFHRLAAEAAQNLALSAALSDPAAAGETLRAAGHELEAALAVLLRRAQDAGAVRRDLTTTELHAVIAGAVLMEQRLPEASKGYGLRLVADGLAHPGKTDGATHRP